MELIILQKADSIDLKTHIYFVKKKYHYIVYFDNNITKFYCNLCKTTSLRRTYCICKNEKWKYNFWNGVVYCGIDINNATKIYNFFVNNIEKLCKFNKNELLNWFTNNIENGGKNNENIILIIIENIKNKIL